MSASDDSLNGLLNSFSRPAKRAAPVEAGPRYSLVPHLDRLERYLKGAPQLTQHFRMDPVHPKAKDLEATLQRLSMLQEAISDYLPRHLVEWKMTDLTPGKRRGDFLEGTILFSDVSGFTALSEKLARQLGTRDGAQKLTEYMNEYFDRMLGILSQANGILLKFAGDAVLVFFPDQRGRAQSSDEEMAIRAGLRMQRAMGVFEKYGLAMSVGLASGHFFAASVGDAQRMEYIVTGQAVSQAMAAEEAAESGQVVADENIWRQLQGDFRFQKLSPGFYQVIDDLGDALDDYELFTPSRRRGWGALISDRDPHLLIQQLKEQLDKVEALAPYLPPDLLDKIIFYGRERQLGEARPATVIFANFIGLTDIIEALGPSESQQITYILDHYFTKVQNIVARQGGIISRVDPYGQSNKMLILFGAPLNPEDAPLRAVEAALEMQAATKDFASLKTSAGTFSLRQRIGITTGPDIFATTAGALRKGRCEYTVMGDDVNLSARLMGKAREGRILISNRMYERVAESFRCKKLTPVTVKGKSQPIPVYQVVAKRKRRKRKRRATGWASLSSPRKLVNRQAELATLKNAVQQALEGEGCFLAICGQAGVGKSRLAERGISWARRRGMRLLQVSCPFYGRTTPYLAWTELLNEHFDLGEADNDAEKRAKIVASLQAIGMEGDIESTAEIMVSQLLGLAEPSKGLKASLLSASSSPPQPPPASVEQKLPPPAEDQEQVAPQPLGLWQLTQKAQQETTSTDYDMFQWLQERLSLSEVLARWIRCQASREPLIILFEDAHRIDSLSLELLNDLSGKVTGWPVLLMAVYRPEIRLDAWVGAAHCQAIDLDDLSRQDTLVLVQALLRDKPPSQALSDMIYRRSRGNPLFVEEMVRTLVETGQLRFDGEARLAAGVEDLTLSATISGLILGRLDRGLGEGGRNVIQIASVIGERFDYEALYYVHALLGGRKPPPLEDVPADLVLSGYLKDLTDENLIHQIEDAQYEFEREAIREAVYESLSAARRSQLHEAVGDYLEAKHADNLDEHSDLLAYHYNQSEQWAKAIDYLSRAGDRATAKLAYKDALRYYQKALDIVENQDGSSRQAARMRGKMASVYLQLSWDDLDDVPDVTQRLSLNLALGWLLWGRGEQEEAARWCHQGLELAQKIDQEDRNVQEALASLRRLLALVESGPDQTAGSSGGLFDLNL